MRYLLLIVFCLVGCGEPRIINPSAPVSISVISRHDMDILSPPDDMFTYWAEAQTWTQEKPFAKMFIATDAPPHTLAHEFGHLIYETYHGDVEAALSAVYSPDPGFAASWDELTRIVKLSRTLPGRFAYWRAIGIIYPAGINHAEIVGALNAHVGVYQLLRDGKFLSAGTDAFTEEKTSALTTK